MVRRDFSRAVPETIAMVDGRRIDRSREPGVTGDEAGTD